MPPLLDEIRKRWEAVGKSSSEPLLQSRTEVVSLDDIEAAWNTMAGGIPCGAVVAHIGDFTLGDISRMLALIELGCIIAPLTSATKRQHDYFFDTIGAEWVIADGEVHHRGGPCETNPLIRKLQEAGRPGLVLFSSGTTGRPKAALHDYWQILDKFRAYQRPALRTMAFLQFDHIGGLNTLLHTLFNAGTISTPWSMRPGDVARQIEQEKINLLPTTPSFLRLALMERAFDGANLSSLRLVTYGTERMEQATLDLLNQTLPAHVDVRQTYGMSELGIFPVKNKSKQELWIRLADPNLEVQVRDRVLWVRSAYRMLGYLNAASPFDADGFYNTKDVVETDGDYFRIVGRADEIINVGGIKVYPSEVEEAASSIPGVLFARARGEPNPILGQHIVLTVELAEGATITKNDMRYQLRSLLDRSKLPHKIQFGQVGLTSRFKKA